jgi:mannosylfructose-phosphate synthase
MITPSKGRRRVRSRIAMISTHGYVSADPPLGAPDTGGQVVYVLELSRKLAQLGHPVDIWTRRFESQPAEEPVAPGVRILRVPCGGDEFIPKEYLARHLPEWSERALRRMKKEHLNYHFVNSHYWDAGLAGEYITAAAGLTHLFTPHSLGSWKKQQMEQDHPEEKESFDAIYNFKQRLAVETQVFDSCSLIIATSPPQLDIIRNDYDMPVDKIRVIPPGYDDNRFFPVSEPSRGMLRENFGFGDHRVIASIGRLARNKGFDLLVDAFQVVAERDPKAILRLAVGTESPNAEGEPLLGEIRERVRQHGLEKRVWISSSLPDEAMADYYRATDVFAMPSRYEPFGMTAIEAMACGTPAVLTVHGGLFRTMAYGIHALYADPFDKEDFGITLLKVLRYRMLRRRLAHEGAHRVRSYFTWTGIAQQLIRLVENRVFPPMEIFEN